MRYWGKLLGLLIAIASGTGFWGMLLGVLLGHLFDKAKINTSQGPFVAQQERQSLFFHTTFQVLGHVSKAKGRVTEVDIQLANQLMDRMQLHGEARTAAQQAFREGKQGDFPLRERLQRFRRVCFGRSDLLRVFLEIQIQGAFADGVLHPNERQVLYVIADELGISRQQLEQFLRMMEGGRQFGGDGQQGHQGYQSATRGPTLEDAYNVLGVNRDADLNTIKRTYRKLMAEHHPDKLVAKGLPPEMMEMAKQKTQAIQAAYDLIKRAKTV